MEKPRSYTAAGLDLVFPRRCAGCGRRGSWVCPDCFKCWTQFEVLHCLRCGCVSKATCRCDVLSDSLDRLRSAGANDVWMRRAIHLFKYDGERTRAAHLASFLTPLVAEMGTIDAIVPVPLHRRRERERGYNQARDLAENLGERTGIAVQELLVRTRPTTHQVDLGREARRANVLGAFSLSELAHVAGMRLLLIDDVVTTGATIGACAEVLAEHKAVVSAMTLAREA